MTKSKCSASTTTQPSFAKTKPFGDSASDYKVEETMLSSARLISQMLVACGEYSRVILTNDSKLFFNGQNKKYMLRSSVDTNTH